MGKRSERNHPEKDLQNTILQYLQIKHIFAWRANTGAAKFGTHFIRFGIPGMADITGILGDGRRLEIECKAPLGKLTPYQKDFLDRIKESGGCTIIARNLDDVINGLIEKRIPQ